MTDEAFLHAIADSPTDDTHRLVYADWLEERGDPRAEWLRLQQTLARPIPDAGRYTDLCVREQELWRTLDPVWLHAVRRYTTAPPCRDIAKLVPALAPFARTTTRLHPRRAPAPLPAWQSKIGGLFLWPKDEEWPQCPECRVPLAPVIQLRAKDVPLIEFPPGMDLFQFFWCPDWPKHGYCPDPIMFWRVQQAVAHARKAEPDWGRFEEGSYFWPPPCSLFPEGVIEYPDDDELRWVTDDEQAEQILATIEEVDLGSAPDLASRFEEMQTTYSLGMVAWPELMTCPGTKAGGRPGYEEEGRRYNHFLTLAPCEWDVGKYRRWLPIEDQRRIAAPGETLDRARLLASDEFYPLREPCALRLGGTQRMQLYVCRDALPWTFMLGSSD